MKIISFIKISILCCFIILGSSCNRHSDNKSKMHVSKKVASHKTSSLKKQANKKPKNKSKKHVNKINKKTITVADVKKKTAAAVSTAKAFTKQIEKSYQEKIDQKVLAFNKELDRLRTKANELSKQAKANIPMEIKALGSKMEGTARQLEDFDKENQKVIDNLSKDFDQMIAKLNSEITTGITSVSKDKKKSNS